MRGRATVLSLRPESKTAARISCFSVRHPLQDMRNSDRLKQIEVWYAEKKQTLELRDAKSSANAIGSLRVTFPAAICSNLPVVRQTRQSDIRTTSTAGYGR